MLTIDLLLTLDPDTQDDDTEPFRRTVIVPAGSDDFDGLPDTAPSPLLVDSAVVACAAEKPTR